VLTIIGCGNSNRTDDGAGVAVAQALQELLRASPRTDVKVFDAGTGGIDVMFQARGSQRLIIIDASKTGSEPGTIYEVPGEELIADREASYSLHDFRWDHALYAGRRIFKDDFPTDVTVYLIESQSLELGLELSDVVSDAVTTLVSRLSQTIDEY
jgi:hydrogenase maturation protease